MTRFPLKTEGLILEVKEERTREYEEQDSWSVKLTTTSF